MSGLQDELENVLSNLKLNIPETLGADDVVDENNWNKIVNSINLLRQAMQSVKDTPTTLPAVGSPYIRCPGMNEPWVQFSSTRKDQWIAVHELYPGCFLRMSGGNASRFKDSSTTVSYDTKAKGDGGGQEDAVIQHHHGYELTHRGDSGLAWGKYKIASIYRTYEATGGVSVQKYDIETRCKNITIEFYVFKG